MAISLCFLPNREAWNRLQFIVVANRAAEGLRLALRAND
jgi:hypothetical protein